MAAMDGEATRAGSLASDTVAGVGGMLRPCGMAGDPSKVLAGSGGHALISGFLGALVWGLRWAEFAICSPIVVEEKLYASAAATTTHVGVMILLGQHLDPLPTLRHSS